MLLSIITINYNNRDGLRKTIESVVRQTFLDFEYIIIDGGSSDGSVEVIKEYANKINYWVSEKDKGIYNAMNKGALVAHGEYTLFLNSGDAFIDGDVLNKVFENDLYADIVCGNLFYYNGGSWVAPEQVTMEYFILGSLPHPSSLIRRSLFDVHQYDERYKIAGDWEFFMYHLIVGNVTYQHIDVCIALFDTTGISSTTNKDQYDVELKQKAVSRIIPPRVLIDYDVYMGKRDDYHRLFYSLGHTNFKMFFYRLIVFLLKVAMFNRGWIKDYSIIHGLHENK